MHSSSKVSNFFFFFLWMANERQSKWLSLLTAASFTWSTEMAALSKLYTYPSSTFSATCFGYWKHKNFSTFLFFLMDKFFRNTEKFPHDPALLIALCDFWLFPMLKMLFIISLIHDVQQLNLQFTSVQNISPKKHLQLHSKQGINKVKNARGYKGTTLKT